MTAKILVVDSQVTNRIVLKVKLLAARYEAVMAQSPEEARALVGPERPDLVLYDCGDVPGGLSALRALRQCPGARRVPIIALGHFCGPDERLAALAAGADDVLTKPIHEVMLLARIRAMLRARDTEAAAEMGLRDEAEQAFGFAEPTEHFQGQVHSTLIIPQSPAAQIRARSISTGLPGAVRVITPEDALGPAGPPANTDLFVVDATCLDHDAFSDQVFRLVPDLRARPDTRHAAQIVILPKGAEGLAAMILDLGASDLVSHDVGIQELAHRARGVLRRKRQQDRQRATLRNGLKAAVTDPLTGLHNRRYAEPQLERMAERARRSGQSFAMMMIDIDHFKAINDRWGHSAGDEVLREFGRRLSDAVRPGDLVARIGGEEFLVAMPETSDRLAQIAAERLCALIEEEPFVLPNRTPLHVTVSIGVAMGGVRAEEALGAVFERADSALYAAKTAGRNTVSLSAA